MPFRQSPSFPRRCTFTKKLVLDVPTVDFDARHCFPSHASSGKPRPRAPYLGFLIATSMSTNWPVRLRIPRLHSAQCSASYWQENLTTERALLARFSNGGQSRWADNSQTMRSAPNLPNFVPSCGNKVLVA